MKSCIIACFFDKESLHFLRPLGTRRAFRNLFNRIPFQSRSLVRPQSVTRIMVTTSSVLPRHPFRSHSIVKGLRSSNNFPATETSPFPLYFFIFFLSCLSFL
uniref:Uncharacterized protein n=1 Tax=Opuntia streptacantha TaxID=393608 RepID=A0A7C8ZNV4_OPUST